MILHLMLVNQTILFRIYVATDEALLGRWLEQSLVIDHLTGNIHWVRDLHKGPKQLQSNQQQPQAELADQSQNVHLRKRKGQRLHAGLDRRDTWGAVKDHR